eukprot:7099032-Lingulodinium_polyedra.AAC.1
MRKPWLRAYGQPGVTHNMPALRGANTGNAADCAGNRRHGGRRDPGRIGNNNRRTHQMPLAGNCP